MAMAVSSMGQVRWALMRLCSAVVTLNLVVTAAQGMNYTTYFLPKQMEALQALLGAWIGSTPIPESNLAGWNSSSITPCSQEYDQYEPNWRGVQCLDAQHDCQVLAENMSNCTAYVTGLTLNNASIHGVLPPEIGNITTLSTLELTGNPDLTGPLPFEINYPYLYTLNLHDNGFNETLPDMQGLFTLISVDLSGNRFVGPFLPQIHKWTYLQIMKLARNHFNDTVPSNAFVNMTQLATLDLSVNELTGSVPDFSACKNLQSLVLSNNSFSGPLPDLTLYSTLQTLKLAYTNLTGTFPFSSFVNESNSLSILDVSGIHLTGSVTNWNGSDLISLHELYLDNNRISGTLDVSALINTGFLRNTTSINGLETGLSTLSMMNTDIANVVYTGSNIESITTLVRLQGSPYCRKKTADDGTRCFCQQFCSIQGSQSNKKVIIIAAVTSSVSILLVIMAFAGAYLYRIRRYKQYLLLQVKQKFEEFDVKPTIFSFNELRSATRDFHPEMKLGEGGYGAVYKGVLPRNSTVAVKQLFVKNSGSIDAFLNEVVLITGMKHRNLVNLKGCCLREHQRLLVYEYVDNYDVDQVLLRGEHKTPVSWAIRQNICLGVARGLHYLHSLAEPRIIHRDIKASNILLDKSFEPKIADFGLALLFPDEKSHIMTVHVAGTKGYLAPEYASLGQLSEKVDVFSFGVLCLEILSGRRNIEESMPLNEMYLSAWAWKLHSEGKLMDLVDPTLKLQDEEKADVQRLFNIALLCSQDAADERPTMARVVAMLQHDDTESEVVALKSGKKGQNLDTMRLLAFGKEEQLPTVTEDEAETPILNAQGGSSTQHAEGSELITVNRLIQLSETRGR